MKIKMILLMALSGMIGGAISNVFMAASMPDEGCFAQSRNRGALEVVRTRRLEIVNDAGATVIDLFATEHGGMLVIRNNEGELAADVMAGSTGGGITISNSEGEPAGTLFASEMGTTFGMHNKQGEIEILMLAGDEGGHIGVTNETGRLRSVELE